MNLKDAFDQEKFVIEDAEYTDEDLQAMSIDDLETLKMRITKKINGLSVAIAEKRIDHANGGKGATKDWSMRHRAALSINQRVLTYVIYLIKKRMRNGRTLSDYFMNAAKSVLPRDVFENILTNAHQEMGNKEKAK